MSKAIAVTDATFEQEVLKSETPVLVDFWATWCGPCRALAPTIDAIAEEKGDKLKIAKLDVDANQQSAIRYGVMSIPTLILFKNGQEVNRLIGNQRKDALLREIERHLD